MFFFFFLCSKKGETIMLILLGYGNFVNLNVMIVVCKWPLAVFWYQNGAKIQSKVCKFNLSNR